MQPSCKIRQGQNGYSQTFQGGIVQVVVEGCTKGRFLVTAGSVLILRPTHVVVYSFGNHGLFAVCMVVVHFNATYVLPGAEGTVGKTARYRDFPYLRQTAPQTGRSGYILLCMRELAALPRMETHCEAGLTR